MSHAEARLVARYILPGYGTCTYCEFVKGQRGHGKSLQQKTLPSTLA
jgi:hypothetical protein